MRQTTSTAQTAKITERDDHAALIRRAPFDAPPSFSAPDRSQLHRLELAGSVGLDVERAAILERGKYVFSDGGELRYDAEQPAPIGDVAPGAKRLTRSRR